MQTSRAETLANYKIIIYINLAASCRLLSRHSVVWQVCDGRAETIYGDARGVELVGGGLKDFRRKTKDIGSIDGT